MSHDLFLQGWSYQRANNIVDALKCYEEAKLIHDKCAIFQWNCMDRYGQCIPINVNNGMNCDSYSMNEEEVDCLYKCYKDSEEPEIQYNLGLLYLYICKKIDQAVHYLMLSVQKEYAPAQCTLGSHYESIGQHKLAFEYYEKSASNGYHRGLVSLGWAYQKGIGTDKDDAEAFRCFVLAAQLGSSDAQWRVGKMYRDGTVVKQNYQTAIKYYRLAIPHQPTAHTMLGYLYANGLGVPRDYNEAAQLYQAASDRGHACASYNLALFYRDGHGVQKDYTMAVKLFQRAHDQGDKDASHKLNKITSLETKISNSLNHYIVTTDYEGISYLFFSNFLAFITSRYHKEWDDPLLRSWVTHAMMSYFHKLDSTFSKSTIDEWFQEFYGLEG